MINIKNKKNHTTTDCDFHICRGFPLGNPFDWRKSKHPDVKFQVKDRDEAIRHYSKYLQNAILSGDPKICDAINKLIIRKFLKQDSNLICYCDIQKEDCHGRVIKEFVENAKYCINWFSNMRRMDKSFVYQEINYWTPENFYQAMKTDKDMIELRRGIATMNPYKAKIFSKAIALRKDWEDIKLDVMKKILSFKFSPQTSWGQKLKEYDGEIVEWNNWTDKFWGMDIYSNSGENNLGKILTNIKNRL